MDFKVTETLTHSQLKNFKEMKQKIIDLHGAEEAQDEPRLLRFLIARDFDVDRATTMLSNNIIWRRKYGIDDLEGNYKTPEIFEKYFPIIFLGYSKFGDLVAMVDFSIDLIGFSKSVSKSDFTLYVIHWLECFCKKLEKRSLQLGKLHQTWIFILDFENTSLSQVTNKNGMDMLISLLPIYEANYPERLQNGYIVNASLPFTIAYAILKPLLYEKTRKKIRIFGKSGWKEELSEIVDLEILPVCLGGKKADPPNLKTFKQAPTIPQDYYKSDECKNNLSSKVGVKRYNVPRLSRVTIKVEVAEASSKIEWEFQTENYEIGFGMRYSSAHHRDDKSNVVEETVIPIQKMDTRVFCETGLFHCERSGTYTIVFDNSFSWLRSKELFVRVDVVKPDGQKICVT